MAILDEITNTRAELLALVLGLDDETIERKGTIGAWSIKNALAHIAAWEEWVLAALPARLASGALPDELQAAVRDEDSFNAAAVAEREELTPDEQVMELERTHTELVTYIRSLGEAQLAALEPWPGSKLTVAEYLRAAIVDHDQEHLDEIRAAVGER